MGGCISVYAEKEDMGGCMRLYDQMGYLGEFYPPI
jgi:hypothetical protein